MKYTDYLHIDFLIMYKKELNSPTKQITLN